MVCSLGESAGRACSTFLAGFRRRANFDIFSRLWIYGDDLTLLSTNNFSRFSSTHVQASLLPANLHPVMRHRGLLVT